MIIDKCERLKYLGFDDKWFLITGIPLMALFIPFAFFHKDFPTMDFSEYAAMWTESLTHVVTYWIGCRWFIIYIRKKRPGFQMTRMRIIIEVLFILIFGAILSPILHITVSTLLNNVPHGSQVEGYIATYFSSFFVLSIYEGIYLYYQNETNIRETEKLKREQVESDLMSLRNQVNPHFLFNSMNTLMSIIPEDSKLATSFLQKLSNVYRYILDRTDDHLITLNEELKFIDSYIFLQKERFKNNLDVLMEIDNESLTKLIVPLSLQIVFENAIKHNIISGKHPLIIQVSVDEKGKLVVENNLQRKKQAIPSTGLGLKNITSRFKYFTDEEVDIIETDKSFTVKIPLLPQA